MRLAEKRQFGWAGLAVLVAACNNPGAATSSPNLGAVTGGDANANSAVGGGGLGAAASAQHVAVFDAFSPANGVAGGGGSGGSLTPPQAVVAPFGISSICGDAIVGPTEECDDGNDGSDACTAECQTRDQAAALVAEGAVVDRYLGAGRHPVSGLADGFIATYVEAGEEPSVGATVFNIWGQATSRLNVSDGASPVDEANPVAAALPSRKYAVSWSDFDGDGSDLGVALRLVKADGSLGPLQAANASREYSQLNPDMLWTGSELVVAWEDYSDAFNGPDVRYRLFDQELNPLSDDLILAGSALPEAAVALATFNGAWAAAYREGTADGKEDIVVKVGEATFRVGPVFGGLLDDRPALVGLDATHWLVAFSAGTDPAATGVYNLPRVRYAVVDTQSAAASAIQSLDPLDDVFSSNNQIAQLTPALETAAEGAYISWRSEARPGDASGDQIWLKFLRWLPDGATTRLRGEEAELLIPRTCDGSIGDQRAPALARTQLPPGGALAIAWTDYGRTAGVNSGEPEVLVHYAPTHLASPSGAPQQVVETWSATTSSPWPARWSSNAAPPVTFSTQNGEGEFNAFSSPGTAFALVNDHMAQNVDLVTTMRFGYPNFAALIARADSDSAPTSYLGALVHTKKADTWRLFAVVNGTATNLQTLPLPQSFYDTGVGVGVDYRVRFRVQTTADGSLFLGLKMWRLGASEPVAWLLETALPTSSPIVQALGGTAGRFGLWASILTANGGRVYFDDFNATYFEGAVAGDLDAAMNPHPLLLPRAVATYRRCTNTAPCTQMSGCCSGDEDCAAGLACSHYQAEGLGLGSHASVCVASHCADLTKNDTEVRADCGGVDCAPCECTSTVALGASGYCSSTSPACRCGIGEYPCTKNAGCLPGLLCGVDAADTWGGAAGLDACVPPHCMNHVKDGDETAVDCGGSCGPLCNLCNNFANGAIGHCRVFCPCTLGEGSCRTDDECVGPNICASGRWNRFGFPAATNVCIPAHCNNNKKDLPLFETGIDCGGECGTCP